MATGSETEKKILENRNRNIEKTYTEVFKNAEGYAKTVTRDAEQASNAAAKEGSQQSLNKFKVFIAAIGIFFSNLKVGIKACFAGKKYSEVNSSSFIGRIAEESYNEGYQAALREYGYGYAEESYDDLFADKYAHESYDSSDEYMRGYYAALADFS